MILVADSLRTLGVKSITRALVERGIGRWPMGHQPRGRCPNPQADLATVIDRRYKQGATVMEPRAQ